MHDQDSQNNSNLCFVTFFRDSFQEDPPQACNVLNE